jgi:hypothetical protein
MMNIREMADCVLQRLKRIQKEIVTRLNAIGALIALYALANPVISDSVLGFLPEPYRPVASVLLPIFWFWIVQKGKEIDRDRVIEKVKEGEIQ